MINEKEIAWPPAYTVKRHPKARRVKLSITRAKGLQITIPPRFSMKHVPDVLVEHEKWIIKHLKRLESTKSETLPSSIVFPAFNEEWKIHYQQNDAKLNLIERAAYEIVLLGDLTNFASCKTKILTWIKSRAKIKLLSLLEELSTQTNLIYHDVTIRDQQTLWGSCNKAKNINLNYRLIFLPLHLIKHVILHELCHTKHLNHSERFWQLLTKFDSLALVHKKELRHADQLIPTWI